MVKRRLVTLEKRSLTVLLSVSMIMSTVTPSFAETLDPIPANYIANGDFESGDTTDWVITDEGIRTSVTEDVSSSNTTNMYKIL